ncbi:Hypothetical predicted protein [Olea europaea subsp. europaea]|uniref:Uncharacterized protein n=1 Tax=Olea europaea subsp. europaea TaxID=158383 RepID=A0A8S0RUM7_OLEEU|nr:Hypothetical predicted protein [Olea europaea subsp. europaea]
MIEDGTRFSEVDAFEFAYAEKNNVRLIMQLLLNIEGKRAAASQRYPFGGIPIDDPKVGLNIMLSVPSAKPRRQICGLKDGRLRDIKTSSSNVCNMEKEIEAESANRVRSS